jgi:hypothetical protein
MKEYIGYDQKNDTIWLAMKDIRTLEKGKWVQKWYIYNGEVAYRPEGNTKAKRFLKNIVILESSRYLDEYRNY